MKSDKMRASSPRRNRLCFKGLRASAESPFARALDAPRSSASKQTSRSLKGRLPEACRRAERVRCPRAALRAAPGQLGHQPPGIRTGARGASLDGDRRSRVTPAQTTSPEAWPEAEPLGWNDSLRREPRWNAVRRARPLKARAAPQGAAVVPASAGVPLPFFVRCGRGREEKSSE